MIHMRHGDLVKAFLKGDVDVLLHQANCQNTMGSGIAKQIREEIPEAYAADSLYYSHNLVDLGGCSSARSNGGTVFNLYGQDFYSRIEGQPCTQYWALFKALNGIKEYLKGKKVGIPYQMGCGLGGGNWGLVYHYLMETYSDLDVYIYKLQSPERKLT